MADHKIDVCNDWNGSKGDKVTFINNTKGYCKITQSGPTWPFRDGPPLKIDPGKSVDTHLKNDLPDNKYPYEVDCCADKVPKYVTVP